MRRKLRPDKRTQSRRLLARFDSYFDQRGHLQNPLPPCRCAGVWQHDCLDGPALRQRRKSAKQAAEMVVLYLQARDRRFDSQKHLHAVGSHLRTVPHKAKGIQLRSLLGGDTVVRNITRGCGCCSGPACRFGLYVGPVLEHGGRDINWASQISFSLGFNPLTELRVPGAMTKIHPLVAIEHSI